MVIKVLGSGCPNCRKVEAHAKEAVNDTGRDIEIQKVTEINEIADHGIIRTPGLIINDVIKSQGKIPQKEEIVQWINEESEGSGQ